MGWLYSDDSFAVGQRDRAFDGSSMVLVHVNAAFRIQDLIQAFSCARLRRWAVFRSGQEAWSYDYEGYDDAERNRPHEHIIHARLCLGADKVNPAVFPPSPMRFAPAGRGAHRLNLPKRTPRLHR